MLLRVVNDAFYPLVYGYFLDSILWWNRHKFIVSSVLMLQTVCVYALKEFFSVERPFSYGVGHSFPSALGANAVFLYVYYAWLIDRNRSLWSVSRYVFIQSTVAGYTLLVLIARYQLLYNSVVDLVAGCAIGAVVAVAFIRYQLYASVIVKWD